MAGDGAGASSELRARVEAIDAELDRLGLQTRAKKLEWLLETRRRYSAQLLRALSEFGATPKARSDWAARLAAADDTVPARRARRARQQGRPPAAIEAQRERERREAAAADAEA